MGFKTHTNEKLKLITETSPCRLGNFRKLILYNNFMVENINIKFLEKKREK